MAGEVAVIAEIRGDRFGQPQPGGDVEESCVAVAIQQLVQSGLGLRGHASLKTVAASPAIEDQSKCGTGIFVARPRSSVPPTALPRREDGDGAARRALPCFGTRCRDVPSAFQKRAYERSKTRIGQRSPRG